MYAIRSYYAIKEQVNSKPLLGICLGMQMLFEKAYEFEEAKGLGLIKGKVDKIVAPGLNIPHMGWNKLEKMNDCELLNGISDDEYVYFVHSYQAYCSDENISAYCEYGGKVPALVFNGNIYGAHVITSYSIHYTKLYELTQLLMF